MKHSSTWYTSILITSVLVLSATINVSGEPRSQKHARKVEAGDYQNAASGDPVATPINQVSTNKPDAHSGGKAYNYNGTFKCVSPPAAPEGGWKNIGDIATVASAIAVAFFTGMLWYVSKRQKELMEKAEATSRRSIELARTALKAERPFVFAESLKLITTARPVEPSLQALFGSKVFGQREPNVGKLEFGFSYLLKNRGKGVAIVDSIRTRFHFARTQWDRPTSQERAQEKTQTRAPRDRVIGPGEQSLNFIFGLYLEPSTWHKILFGQLQLILVGVIRYHDTFDNPSVRQDFCFRYRVMMFDAQTYEVQEAFFFGGPDKNNRYHEVSNAAHSPSGTS